MSETRVLAETGDVVVLSSSFSDGVTREIAINDATAVAHNAFIDECKTPQEYYQSPTSSAGDEYAAFMRQFSGRNLKVLDIGVGRGESSTYLAAHGHSITAIEPSLGFCRVIRAVADKFSLDITPIQATAEDMGKLQVGEFDLVIFNSSLHHCDDPVLALRNSFGLLKQGGTIVLSTETYLRPWQSKKVWYERLETHPVEMGHYGGNEHVYYNWEYKKMLLTAEFVDVTFFPPRAFLDPLQNIENKLRLRFNGERMYTPGKILARLAYYIILAKALKSPFLFKAISNFSLMPSQVQARKA